MVREFAEKEIAPIASELDEKGEYPTKILEKMAKLGLLGVVIPNEYGGAGLDTISYATVVEEIRALASHAVAGGARRKAARSRRRRHHQRAGALRGRRSAGHSPAEVCRR